MQVISAREHNYNVQTAEQQRVVEYFRTEYAASSKVPSVRSVCDKFKLDTKSFYKIFAEGKREVCKLAGIPEDRKSFERIEKAADAVRNKSEKQSLENEELRVSREKEKAVAEELRRVQTIVESRENLRKLEEALASTAEGRKQIFSSPQRLLEFSTRMIDYESCVTSNLSVWDSFVVFCKQHNLDLARKLFEVAGPQEEYGEHADEDDLHNYLGFKLEVFLLDWEAEQKQKAMQTKFESVLQDFRCNECGRDIHSTYLVNSALCCRCGSRWMLLCVNCKKELQFDPKTDALHCSACGMSFKLVLHGSLSNA